jgi:hypothetical protein
MAQEVTDTNIAEILSEKEVTVLQFYYHLLLMK